MIQDNVGSNWPASPVKAEYEHDTDVVRLAEQLHNKMRANSRDSRDAMAAGTAAGAIEGSLLGVGSSR